ncbi:hypothetical protein CWIS_04500 [Cellulomonas sp. A375-1]|nr:hypothetical protein CWIS_04500 [Cellulomonas sp. A375-1]
MVVVQVPGDGVRAGGRASGRQVLAEFDDELDDRAGRGVRGAVRASRTRLERCLPVHSVAREQLVDPRAGGSVVAGDLRDRATFEHDSGDDQTSLRHARPS